MSETTGKLNLTPGSLHIAGAGPYPPPYGRSPAMDGLNEIRELERLCREDPELYSLALKSFMRKMYGP